MPRHLNSKPWPENSAYFLPNPNVGVLNAKFLIESFVVPNMKNSKAFIDDFNSYSANVSVTVATVVRAMDQLSKRLKVS
jgi:hypothetical protein